MLPGSVLGLFVCICDCFMLDMVVVDLALEAFSEWLSGLLGCCMVCVCYIVSCLLVVGLAWLPCVACGFWFVLVSVFG